MWASKNMETLIKYSGDKLFAFSIVQWLRQSIQVRKAIAVKRRDSGSLMRTIALVSPSTPSRCSSHINRRALGSVSRVDERKTDSKTSGSEGAEGAHSDIRSSEDVHSESRGSRSCVRRHEFQWWDWKQIDDRVVTYKVTGRGLRTQLVSRYAVELALRE